MSSIVARPPKGGFVRRTSLPHRRLRPVSGGGRNRVSPERHPRDGRETRGTVGNPTRSRLPGATPATAPERGGGGTLAGRREQGRAGAGRGGVHARKSVAGTLRGEGVSSCHPLPAPGAKRGRSAAGVPGPGLGSGASETPCRPGPAVVVRAPEGRGSRALRRAVGSRPVTRTGGGSLRPTRGVPRRGGTGRRGGARRRTPAAARSRGTDRRGRDRSPRSRSRG